MILEDVTLEELFTGVKLDMSYLCTFNNPIYVHNPIEKRTKLDHSLERGVFVGYSEVSKTYRVYILG